MTDDQRDDELLARIAAGVPPADADEAAARAPYQRLVDQLRGVGEPAGLGQRIDNRLREEAARERRRRWWLGGGLALAAAATVAALVLRPRTTPRPRLAVAVTARDGAVRRGAAAVGDTLRLDADPPGAHGELRVYLDGRLVARCPGAGACHTDGRRLHLEVPAADPGAYRVVVLGSASPIPAPGADGIDSDLLAARTAGATVVTREPIVVEP